MNQVGRSFIGLGLVLIVVGLALVVGGKLGLGRLPGDIVVERKNFRFQFPVVTSLLVSVILSIVLNLLLRRR